MQKGTRGQTVILLCNWLHQIHLASRSAWDV
jgi:hypothetical protein